MTTTEMVVMFYDLLETANPVFRTSGERPITEVVIQYLNEEQVKLFNNRYLPSNFLENIQTIKASKNELKDLLSSSTPALSSGTRFDYSKTFPWSTETTFVEGTVSITRGSYPITGQTPVKVDLVPIFDFNVNKYITNHINKPIILQPVVFADKSEGVYCIMYDAFTIVNSATITVLNKPALINLTSQNCQLHSKLHEQMVRNAVTTFLVDKTILTPKKDDSIRDAV